jgi:hypothetical protein
MLARPGFARRFGLLGWRHLPRAGDESPGHADDGLHEVAWTAKRNIPCASPLRASPAAQPWTEFAGSAAWLSHLDRLGFTQPDVTAIPAEPEPFSP